MPKFTFKPTTEQQEAVVAVADAMNIPIEDFAELLRNELERALEETVTVLEEGHGTGPSWLTHYYVYRTESDAAEAARRICKATDREFFKLHYLGNDGKEWRELYHRSGRPMTAAQIDETLAQYPDDRRHPTVELLRSWRPKKEETAS